jgi:hypothetical protein
MSSPLCRLCNRVVYAKRVSRENKVELWHVAPPALIDLLAKDYIVTRV